MVRIKVFTPPRSLLGRWSFFFFGIEWAHQRGHAVQISNSLKGVSLGASRSIQPEIVVIADKMGTDDLTRADGMEAWNRLRLKCVRAQ